MNKVWQCKFLISIDSSIGHLASIQEIPQIVLFGPFNETYSKPLNINAIILRPKDTISSFKPYYDRFNNNLPRVTDIKVTDVTTSIKELLKKQH